MMYEDNKQNNDTRLGKKIGAEKLILSTGSLYTFPLEKIFEIGQEVGFSGFELMLRPAENYSSTEDLLKTICAAGATVNTLHSPFLYGGRFKNQWKAPLETLDIAKELGASLVIVHPPFGRFLRGFNRRRFAGLISKLEEGAGSEIKIVTENMPLRKIFGMFPVNAWALGTIDEIERFLETSQVSLTLDITHLATRRITPQEIWERLRSRVINIHISDYLNGVEHLLPGRGRVNIGGFLRRVSKSGYNGFLTLEVCPVTNHCEIAAQACGELKRCREWILEQIR